MASRVQSTDDFTPVGRGSAEQVASVRAAASQASAELDQATRDGFVDMLDESGAVHEAWAESVLPDRSWWVNLSWSSVLRLGARTFVQVPDRFRGAFVTARRKSLEVLAAATDAGSDCEAEWKMALTFEALLLATTRTDTTCAELLEERLALWWSGRWAALWHTSANWLQARAPAAKSTPKQKAAVKRDAPSWQ